MPFWSIAMTKASSENLAQYHLLRQGFTTYLPKFLSKTGTKTKIKVLFPRYIFVVIELQWHKINGTRGISRLLMNEKGPVVLPKKVVDGLKMKEDNKGLITLTTPPKFKVGEKVRVVRSLLEGYDAIYDGMRPNERVRVLIEMLGQRVPVELEEGDLVPYVDSGSVREG